MHPHILHRKPVPRRLQHYTSPLLSSSAHSPYTKCPTWKFKPPWTFWVPGMRDHQFDVGPLLLLSRANCEGLSRYASNKVLSSAWALPRPFWSKSNTSYCFSLAYLSTLYCDEFQALISPPFNHDHSPFHPHNWVTLTPAYDPSPSFLELFIIGLISSVLFQKDCVTNDNRSFLSISPFVCILFHQFFPLTHLTSGPGHSKPSFR